MNAIIRKALLTDVAAMVDLSEQKRTQYQNYQPRFWRKAAHSREKQLPFFERLVSQDDVITLVYDLDRTIGGFIIASLVTAPPVYDPQGPTCLVDDYCIAQGQTWELVGKALLDEVAREAQERGAAQLMVVCGHQDQAKREMLAHTHFTIASEWYVRDL